MDSANHAPEGRFGLSGFCEPDVYSAPYMGKMYQLAITAATFAQIVEVVTEYFHAFDAAAAYLEESTHAD